MTVLLRWLIDHVWVFYALCGVGILLHLIRALNARREQSRAVFTLEEEAAIARSTRSWSMVFLFVFLGVTAFACVTFVLPELPMPGLTSPLPTPTSQAGVEPITPEPTKPTETPLSSEPSLTTTASLPPTPPPPDPTETPMPNPTEPPTSTPTPAGVSGEMSAQFGNFTVLVGYRLPATEVTTAESLPITLYWRGLEGASPTDYLVFTHLLSEDGRLIAQHDGPPANGTRPVTDWNTGETIEDPHPMTFDAEAQGYVGPATIAVGLYDPGDPGNRVPTTTGQGFVTLPVTIDVVPQ